MIDVMNEMAHEMKDECHCSARLKADTGLENFITVPHYADCPVLKEELPTSHPDNGN